MFDFSRFYFRGRLSDDVDFSENLTEIKDEEIEDLTSSEVSCHIDDVDNAEDDVQSRIDELENEASRLHDVLQSLQEYKSELKDIFREKEEKEEEVERQEEQDNEIWRCYGCEKPTRYGDLDDSLKCEDCAIQSE